MVSHITTNEHEELRRLMESENRRLDEENYRQNHCIKSLEKSVQQGKRLEILEWHNDEKWRKAISYIGTAILDAVLVRT